MISNEPGISTPPVTTPSWRGRRGVRGSLPRPFTPFIGREHEIELASSLLNQTNVRLLTLTGPGGIGKTRLALRVAAQVEERFAGGTFFVALASVPSDTLVMKTIAQTLGVGEEAGIPIRDSVIATLHDAELLLVIDNFEHVLGAAPELSELLAACPQLKMLVTSRSLLRVAGEQAIPVPPLDLPQALDSASYEQLANSAAIELFTNRARAVDPAFSLDEQNVRLVAGICSRMGAMPLAIELSAAQIGVLPLAGLLAQIEARLPLPISGPRDAPLRLRTLHDAVGWSYDLLHPDQQLLFRLVSVFPGGFSLDAVQFLIRRIGTATLPHGGDIPVLAQLAGLVESSLIRRQPIQDDTRFTMLEPIRDFAFDVLQQEQELNAARDALAAWCLHIAESSALATYRPVRSQELQLLEREHANCRAAIEWLYQQGDANRLLRLAAALGRFWQARGYSGEGYQWLERALAMSTGDEPVVRAIVMMQFGRFAYVRGDLVQAVAGLPEAQAILTAFDHRPALVSLLNGRGIVAAQIGEHDQSERFLQQALELATSIDDSELAAAAEASVAANLGVAAELRGDTLAAVQHHEYALRLRLEHDDIVGAISTLCDLGDASRELGDYPAAIRSYRECLQLIGDQADLRIAIDVFTGAAVIAAAWNDHARAARLIGAAETVSGELGFPIFELANRAAVDRASTNTQHALGEQAFLREKAIGRDLSLADAIAEVFAISPTEQAFQKPVAPALKLSPREQDVLRLIVDGLTDRQIADALFISVRTAEGHSARLIAKLGVQGRTGVVRAALDLGLVT